MVAGVAVIALACVSLKYLVCLRADRDFRLADRSYTYLDNQLKLMAQTESRLARLQGRLTVIKELGYYPDPLEIIGFLTQNTPSQIYLRDITIGRPKESEDQEQGQPMPRLPIPQMPPMAGMFALKGPTPPTAPQITDRNESNAEDLQLTLQGKGPTHLITATYLTILKGSPFFTNVILKHATRMSPEPTDAIEFEIVCTLNPSTTSHAMTELSDDYQQ